jgi:hypothetical protein
VLPVFALSVHDLFVHVQVRGDLRGRLQLLLLDYQLLDLSVGERPHLRILLQHPRRFRLGLLQPSLQEFNIGGLLLGASSIRALGEVLHLGLQPLNHLLLLFQLFLEFLLVF